MNGWNAIGSYVDGWAKFALTLVAVGWFGLQVADRYAPRSATVTIGASAPTQSDGVESQPRIQTAALTQPIDGEPLAREPAVAGELLRELGAAISGLVANSFAQLAAMLFCGMTGGLVLQPQLSKWRASRAVRAARRRANRHAADLRLLAANDAKGNVPGPAVIQPLKR